MENVNIIAPTKTQLSDTGGSEGYGIDKILSKYPGTDLLIKQDGATYYSNKISNHMDLEMTNETSHAIEKSDITEYSDANGASDCFTAAFAVSQLEGEILTGVDRDVSPLRAAARVDR